MISSTVDVQRAMSEMERRQEKGELPEDEMEQLNKDLMGKVGRLRSELPLEKVTDEGNRSTAAAHLVEGDPVRVGGRAARGRRPRPPTRTRRVGREPALAGKGARRHRGHLQSRRAGRDGRGTARAGEVPSSALLLEVRD